MNERELMFPDWQLQYFAALSEGSPETLRERVEDAETAILTRLAQLARTPEREMEHFAIKDALDSLYMIKKEKLDFPR
jgi:peptide subunit release factor 1 (eRF1)